MATHILIRSTQYLLDARPPQQIQAQLERSIMVAFAPAGSAAPAARMARFTWPTKAYRFTLQLLDVLPHGNSYSLAVEVDLEAAADKSCAELEAERRWSQGQLAQWTSDLRLLPTPAPGPGSAQRHQALVEAWRAAEAPLTDVLATQRAILSALRDGAVFSTVHLEGGTIVRHDGQRFVIADFGPSQKSRRFASDAEVLSHLRAQYDRRIGWRNELARATDADAWRLIYRQLETPMAGNKVQGMQARAAKAVACVAVCGLAFGLTYLKVQRGVESRRTDIHYAQLSKVPNFSNLDAGGHRTTGLLENERKFKRRLQDYKRATPH